MNDAASNDSAARNTAAGKDAAGIHLETSLGYLLKEAASALRSSMEAVLRPLGMNITHYSCLELLAQRPGLSNSELARGAFVSRQSMNVLLQSLERDGFVSRAESAAEGRAIPTQLTELGRGRLKVASAAVKGVEQQMLTGLESTDVTHLRLLLGQCITSLSGPTADD